MARNTLGGGETPKASQCVKLWRHHLGSVWASGAESKNGSLLGPFDLGRLPNGWQKCGADGRGAESFGNSKFPEHGPKLEFQATSSIILWTLKLWTSGVGSKSPTQAVERSLPPPSYPAEIKQQISVSSPQCNGASGSRVSQLKAQTAFA